MSLWINDKGIYYHFELFFGVVTGRPVIAAEKDSLTGKWLIRHIYNYGNVDDTPPIYFHFGDKIISAYDGCNYVSFYYQSEEKNKVKFDVVNTASTLMGCTANGAILSEKWREMINKVNKYEITPEALYLLHHDKRLATLVEQDNKVIGIRWQVKGYNVNGGVQFRSDMPNIWIALKSNGSIEGEGECFPFIGTYQIDELKNSVKFNVRSTSLERCSKNSDAWRRQNFLMKNINDSFKFDRTGNNLYFSNSNGAMTISASR